MDEPSSGAAPWLLLVHQLPTEPSRVRVKTWRRLQSVGAVAVKNSVWVLPYAAETREDFEWIRAEIVAQGGEAMVFTAHAADGISSAEIRDAIESARQADWRELATRCREALAVHGRGAVAGEDLASLQRQARSLRARADRLERIDHFKVAGRTEALEALARLESRLDPAVEPRAEGAPPRRVADYRGRVWLTRPRPAVDRMASAWLIRRFIDPEASFQFADRIPPRGGVVPFDMFGVELGHHGERVTFETLLREFGLDDPALARVARIVHALDLRSEDPGDPETAMIERLVEGLRSSLAGDDELLEHGMALFEALYASFSSAAASTEPDAAG